MINKDTINVVELYFYGNFFYLVYIFKSLVLFDILRNEICNTNINYVPSLYTANTVGLFQLLCLLGERKLSTSKKEEVTYTLC